MDNIPFYLFYLLSFLESMSIFYFVFVFNRIKTSWGIYFLIVAVYPILVYAIRKLPISFGMHSIIIVFIVAVFLSFYFKKNFYLSLISMIILFAILIVLEYLMLMVSTKLLAMGLSELLDNKLYWFLSGIPHILLIAAIAYSIQLLRGKNEY